MKYNNLGSTNLLVSSICFGCLTIGPLQANLTVAEGAAVIRRALELGINFIDTAEFYRTYPYIKAALTGWDREVVIASKSYACTYHDMAKSVEQARRQLNRDVIEIFLLHERDSPETIEGHRPALDYLMDAKSRGIIKAVGISAHHVPAVAYAAQLAEIDVIHPLINITGLGIQGGSLADMMAAITAVHRAGKGIYGMKPLGGGNLLGDVDRALEFVFSLPELHAVAIGMKSVPEVEYNVAKVSGRAVPDSVKAEIDTTRRKLHVEDWCTGCGNCFQACPTGAVRLVKGKAVVDQDKCLLCGYCGGHCPEFCIKIF